MVETAFYRILVAIETDVTPYPGPVADRPAVLEDRDAEQLLAHLAADLKALMPDIARCSLIAAGALYDQTQLLRPSYPLFTALENVSTDRREERFSPRLVSIGARDGSMPVDSLQPDGRVPPGLLQLLPVIVQGPAAEIRELGQAMEYRFMEEGQLSAHSAAWLQTAFGVTINHARLMTLTDLNAMLRMQLEHFGFLPLWELLDSALEGDGALKVNTQLGNCFELRDGAVHSDFQTFDFWANNGGGSEVPAQRGELSAAYADWTRETRQYLTTLEAHGIQMIFHDPASGRTLESAYLTERSDRLPRAGDATVTEHSFGDIGTVAITVVDDGQVRNLYPLQAADLNRIHEKLRRSMPAGHTVAFPCDMLYDEEHRQLIPEPDAAPDPH
ncbi:MAG: hypothetical protein PVI83_05960 [Lysobacterales bacterium]|jgi:hypothetical protein